MIYEDKYVEDAVESLVQTEKRSSWEFAIEIEGAPDQLDILAKDLNYEPVTIGMQEKNFGSQQVSMPTATERTTLVLTVRDTKYKLLYHWCKSWAGEIARSDGTFGLPEQYVKAVTIYSNSNKLEDPWPTKYQMMLTNVGAINPDRSSRNQYLEFPITLTEYKTSQGTEKAETFVL